MFKKFILFTIPLLLLISCAEKKEIETPYTKSINEWHTSRVERLKESIWLRLAGLYWLEEGENTFGSDKSNSTIFPENTPAHIGKFILENGEVKVVINNDVDVMCDSAKVTELKLISDVSENKNDLTLGSYTWFLVERGGKFGIRLYDDNNPALAEFTDIETYPADSTWRIEADYIPYDPPKLITIPSIIGYADTDSCKGRLQFEKDGQVYSLDPVSSSEYGFFIVFADETSGKETYGAGRFLSASAPDENNKVIIDFNKSYNPPCAFSKYATCPLPPKDNYLKLAVTAGEKNFGHH